MGKRKKRREHSGSGGSSSNSSDTKLVSSVLNETNTVLHRETVMQSSAQLNAPVQHLATSTPVMNSEQQYMQMLNSPILSPSLNQADVHSVPPPWAVALANSIRSVDQKVDDVSKTLEKLERVEAKMADFEKELSNLRVEISQSRVKTVEMITVLNDREREFFYLTTHSTHFIYSYMASDIWLRTILIVRKESRCRHIGYSYRLTARVLLYAPSHRQDNTYHGFCYTSRGALDGTRNS